MVTQMDMDQKITLEVIKVLTAQRILIKPVVEIIKMREIPIIEMMEIMKMNVEQWYSQILIIKVKYTILKILRMQEHEMEFEKPTIIFDIDLC